MAVNGCLIDQRSNCPYPVNRERERKEDSKDIHWISLRDKLLPYCAETSNKEKERVLFIYQQTIFSHPAILAESISFSGNGPS